MRQAVGLETCRSEKSAVKVTGFASIRLFGSPSQGTEVLGFKYNV